MLCLLLVLSERVINLAAPIAFKHMVEVLGALVSTPAASGQQEHVLVRGMRHLLLTITGASAHMHAQQAAGVSTALPSAALNSTQVLPAVTATGPAAGILQDETILAPFWVLFYPWVFIYLGAFFLRGGSGSEGLLANLRDILWIPITQVRRHANCLTLNAFQVSGHDAAWLEERRLFCCCWQQI
jgi:hypothetical protein